jgi:hypothetical protein
MVRTVLYINEIIGEEYRSEYKRATTDQSFCITQLLCETQNFVIDLQDKVVETRHKENIGHIFGGYSLLSQKKYRTWHTKHNHQ